jgi:hypothetical protein
MIIPFLPMFSAVDAVGLHKLETMTNVQNHLVNHKLNDSLKFDV